MSGADQAVGRPVRVTRLEIARGTAKPARLHVPPGISVRGIREKALMSQDQFASAYGFTVYQIRP